MAKEKIDMPVSPLRSGKEPPSALKNISPPNAPDLPAPPKERSSRSARSLGLSSKTTPPAEKSVRVPRGSAPAPAGASATSKPPGVSGLGRAKLSSPRTPTQNQPDFQTTSNLGDETMAKGKPFGGKPFQKSSSSLPVPKGTNKIAKVQREFKEGSLKSSSGQKVTNPKQAIAIGLSEQRKAGK